MLPGYLDGLRQAGGLPIILPLSDDPAELTQLAALCSGFLFTGGQDVSPEVYREPPHDLTEPCPLRDAMERRILEYALAEDKPILGVCRGIQFINAALGGTLYQDLPSQHPSDTVHRQPPPYERPVHNVAVRADTPLHRCLGVSALPVNSLHHQAVKDLAPRPRADGGRTGRGDRGPVQAGQPLPLGGTVAPGVFLPGGGGEQKNIPRLRRRNGMTGREKENGIERHQLF